MGAGAERRRSGSWGPREERGSEGTSTKRREDKDDGEHDTVTVIPGMYMQDAATSGHSEKPRE